MKNGLLSGGLNPGPLGHESSALPLDHGYSPTCRTLVTLKNETDLIFQNDSALVLNIELTY